MNWISGLTIPTGEPAKFSSLSLRGVCCTFGFDALDPLEGSEWSHATSWRFKQTETYENLLNLIIFHKIPQICINVYMYLHYISKGQ